MAVARFTSASVRFRSLNAVMGRKQAAVVVFVVFVVVDIRGAFSDLMVCCCDCCVFCVEDPEPILLLL